MGRVVVLIEVIRPDVGLLDAGPAVRGFNERSEVTSVGRPANLFATRWLTHRMGVEKLSCAIARILERSVKPELKIGAGTGPQERESNRVEARLGSSLADRYSALRTRR